MLQTFFKGLQHIRFLWFLSMCSSQPIVWAIDMDPGHNWSVVYVPGSPELSAQLGRRTFILEPAIHKLYWHLTQNFWLQRGGGGSKGPV